MEINERLAALRAKVGATTRAFGERLNLTGGSITNMEKGSRAITDRTIADICREFNVNEEWLRTGKGEMFAETPDEFIEQLRAKYGLSDIAMDILNAYAAMSPEHKAGFDSFVERLVELRTSKHLTVSELVSGMANEIDDNDDYDDEEEDDEEVRQLPLFEYPASAGRGVFAGEGEYNYVDVPDGVPYDAAFAVRIYGDSMSPIIPDGSIAWVRQQPTVDDGEVCVATINDQGYCKVKKGNKFVSINSNYKPIRIKEGDVVRITGKVVYVQKP